MLVERIEGKWIDVFARVFEMCAVDKTQTAAILSETQSRNVNVNPINPSPNRNPARLWKG